MSTSTIPDASIVCAPRGALAARLPIVAALIFSAGRTVIVLTGGLPWPGLDEAVGWRRLCWPCWRSSRSG